MTCKIWSASLFFRQCLMLLMNFGKRLNAHYGEDEFDFLIRFISSQQVHICVSVYKTPSFLAAESPENYLLPAIRNSSNVPFHCKNVNLLNKLTHIICRA